MSQKTQVITYVDCKGGAALNPGFVRACYPVQSNEKFMVVERPIESVQALASAHKQTGIVLTPGTCR